MRVIVEVPIPQAIVTVIKAAVTTAILSSLIKFLRCYSKQYHFRRQGQHYHQQQQPMKIVAIRPTPF
jgi:hypothetical protein